MANPGEVPQDHSIEFLRVTEHYAAFAPYLLSMLIHGVSASVGEFGSL
jgi:hypothetical protein